MKKVIAGKVGWLQLKGMYIAVYKKLNVTIKRYFSREHSERMLLYERSAGVDKIVCGSTRGTYVHVLVQCSSGLCEYRPVRKRTKEDTPRSCACARA